MITGDTAVLTTKGWLKAAHLAEYDDADVLDASTGQFVQAPVSTSKRDFGPVWTYTLVPYSNTGEQRQWWFKAPRPCGVSLVNTKKAVGDLTYDLRLKDALKANSFDCGYSASNWARGFMYRHDILSVNGLDPAKYPLHQERLAALKASGEIVTPDGLLPVGETPSRIGSFLRGYLAADGYKNKLVTCNEEFFRFFVVYHGYAGLVLTGAERTVRKFIKIDKTTEFFNDYEVSYCKGADFNGFRVSEISGPSDNYEQLYGVYMPEGHDYVIKGGWTVLSD